MLEEALNCCDNNLQVATVRLQKNSNPSFDQTQVNMNLEENKGDVSMKPKRPIKSNLINIFLNSMEKVASREEAVKLTEMLLQRYKGTIQDTC